MIKHGGKQSLRISLTNIHSFHNAGDAALVNIAIDRIRKEFPGSRLTLWINDPESYSGDEMFLPSFTYWAKRKDINRKSSWRLLGGIIFILQSLFAAAIFKTTGRTWLYCLSEKKKNLLYSYLSSDLVVCVPGNSLYHSGRYGLAFFFSLYSMAFAAIIGKPIYILPQSIGPLKYYWEKYFTHWVFNHAQLIEVRENISKNTLISYGINPDKVILVPDLAFLQEPSDALGISEISTSHNKSQPEIGPLLGISVINWQGQYPHFSKQSIYEDSIFHVVEWHINNTGGHVAFFPQVTGPSLVEDDRQPARRIISRLSNIHRNLVINLEQSFQPSQLKTLYGFCECFVGTRLHACIFALSMGVPALPIGYLHKTRGVYEMFGLDHWLIDINLITPDIMIKQYNKFWLEREQIRQKINTSLPKIIKDAEMAVTWIREDYDRLAKD